MADAKSKTKEEWVEEAVTYYNAQSYKEALQACEHALQLDPTYARAHHGRGLILFQMKAYEKAKDAYEQACRLAPNKAKIYLDMGELLYILGDYQESGAFYKKAIQLNGKYETIYLEKAQSLRRQAYPWEHQKCYEEAIRVYKNVLMFNPDAYATRSLLAVMTAPEAKSNPSEQGGVSYGYPHTATCRCPFCMNY